MKKINIKKSWYHIRHDYMTLNNVVVAVGLFIAASWAWGSIGVLQRNYDLQKEVDSMTRQEKLLGLETQNLTYEQRYYRSAEYQELAVRDRLGLGNPGEKALILPPNSKAAKQEDAKATNEQPVKLVKPSNFEQWTNFIFGGNQKSLQ